MSFRLQRLPFGIPPFEVGLPEFGKTRHAPPIKAVVMDFRARSFHSRPGM